MGGEGENAEVPFYPGSGHATHRATPPPHGTRSRHTCIHTHKYRHMHTNTLAYIQADIRTHTHAYMHLLAQIPSYKHIHGRGECNGRDGYH